MSEGRNYIKATESSRRKSIAGIQIIDPHHSHTIPPKYSQRRPRSITVTTSVSTPDTKYCNNQSRQSLLVQPVETEYPPASDNQPRRSVLTNTEPESGVSLQPCTLNSSTDSSEAVTPSSESTAVQEVENPDMANNSRIKGFYGYRNGKEDPEEYLEDIDFAYMTGYIGKAVGDDEEKTKHKENTCRILFRQNLIGNAATWYADLPKEIKADWAKLRISFEEAYKLETNEAADKFMIVQAVATLAQRTEEGIAAYLRRAEELYRRVPAYDITFGFNVVRGMKDESQRKVVLFECSKDQDYTWDKVKRVIMAAYQTIGQIDPMVEKYGTTDDTQLGLTGHEWQQQILPSILQGMRSLNTQSTALMNYLQTSNGGAQTLNTDRPRTNSSTRANVTCFGCNERGHYRNECPHTQGGPNQLALPMQAAARAILPRGGSNSSTPLFNNDDPYNPMSSYNPAACVLELTPAMAATRSAVKKAKGVGVLTQSQSVQKDGALKQARAAKQIAGRNQNVSNAWEASHGKTTGSRQPEANDDDMEWGGIEPSDKEQEEPTIDMRAEATFEYPNGQPTQVEAPIRKIEKGQVKELIQSKEPKVPNPIRILQGRNRFNIRHVMEIPVTLPLGQLLNESQQLRKEVAWGMQSTTPRYRVKKAGEERAAMRAALDQTYLAYTDGSTPPKITARALEDDGEARPLFVTSWVESVKVARTLVDGGSLVELVSQRVMDQLPHIRIHADGHVNVSLADDQSSTLTRYAWIPVNVEGVQAIIKAYILPVTAYDLLLGVKWQRRVRMDISHGKGKVTLIGDDDRTRIVQSHLAPAEITALLPTVEVDDDDDPDTDEMLQTILEEENSGKGRR